VACGFGPIVLAILYLILRQAGIIEMLSVEEVCTGIFSLTALAFVAGGMNAIYQHEQIPLMVAILIHGGALYISYLGAYLLNGWLEWGVWPILVFTGVFAVGYLVIWMVIYSVIKRKTAKLNQSFKKKRCTM
jgi:hypothetical protein